MTFSKTKAQRAHKTLKILTFSLLGVLIFMSPMKDKALANEALWSKSAHDYLLIKAFERHEDVSSACLEKMKQGSNDLDSLRYQMGQYSYMHAMRDSNIFGPDQSRQEAREQMLHFINSTYESAREMEKTEYLDSCHARGQALHPVMDYTSPSHESFQKWHILAVSQYHKHGDFPGSEEDLKSLRSLPDTLSKTLREMVRVDTLGMEGILIEDIYQD